MQKQTVIGLLGQMIAVDAIPRLTAALKDPDPAVAQSAAAALRCARMNERICLTASGIRSLGSFQGKTLTSALGASMADSMATA